MKIIPRHLQERLERALQTSRIVNVVGPRQAGKTTLVRDLTDHARYVTLDHPNVRAGFEADPRGQLELLGQERTDSSLPVVIDEVQRVPELTLALKERVDRNTDPGQFVLTGSSDIFTTGEAYDSLAGRVMTLTLRPLSAGEIAGRGPCSLLDAVSDGVGDWRHALPDPTPFTRDEVIDHVVRGGFPEIRPLPDRDRIDRYSSYLDSIIERDVAPVAEVRKPDALRRLTNQIAARTAEELTVASLSEKIGLTQATIERYLDILSQLGIVHLLGAWRSSRTRREIKAPKLHFLDTGCATALRGEDASSFGLEADPTALGKLLETFAFVELEKSLPFQSKPWRLYHWRAHRREIDIIAEAPGRILALLEVKASSTVDSGDFRHIDWFMQEGPGDSYRTTGFVFHLGDELVSFGPDRLAVPLSMLWSFPPGG